MEFAMLETLPAVSSRHDCLPKRLLFSIDRHTRVAIVLDRLHDTLRRCLKISKRLVGR